MSKESTQGGGLATAKPAAKPSLAKTGRKTKKTKAQVIDVAATVAQAPVQTLAQVAVTAARSEGEVAKRVYLEEKQVVTNEFFEFIRGEQSASSVAIEDAVLGFHGLTRDDLYEQPEPQVQPTAIEG